jgi:CubicO group peptidase (beta-lactamase class C family)
MMASMDVHGTAEPVVEPVRDCLAAVLDGQPGTGAAFAAWHDGRLVADLWGGHADAARTRPWEAGSIVQPYSVSKPFAAVCVLHLAAEGRPGTAHGESALFYGHLAGELVRRVDGRSVGRYLREEICGPLGLDFSVGPGRPQQARAVELTGLDDAFRADSVAGKPPLFERAMLNPPGALDPVVVNSPEWRAAEIPAINGHGTARAVAGFYHALAAGQLLAPGLLAEAIIPQRTGPDRVFGEETSWGLGFGIDGADYGMAGVGGSYGGTNTAGGYSIAYLTGCAGTFEPLATVENEFRRCLGLPPLAD